MVRKSTEIKRILRREFPNAKFRVRVQIVGYSEAIHVKTNLIKPLTNEEQCILWKGDVKPDEMTDEEWELYWKIKEKIKKNREIEDKIRELLKDYEHIHYDERTGEILLGGNTYLFVEPLSN